MPGTNNGHIKKEKEQWIYFDNKISTNIEFEPLVYTKAVAVDHNPLHIYLCFRKTLEIICLQKVW